MSNKDAIARALETHNRVSSDLLTAAVRTFGANLRENSCPTPEELQSALEGARRTLVDGVFQRDRICGLFKGEVPADSRLDAIRLQLNTFAPKVNAPPLPATLEAQPLRLAAAAMLGAVLGISIGSPFGIYLLASRDTGLVLGAPLGAFLTTWGALEASRNKSFSNFLVAALAFTTVAEAWSFLSTNPLTAVWKRLSGQSGRGAITRIGIYLLLIGLLVFTRRRASFDRSILEANVRELLDQWLYGVMILVALLGDRSSETAAGDLAERKAFGELGRRFIELHAASAATLPGVAEDVIETARAAGFEGIRGPVGFSDHPNNRDDQLLEWDEVMRERFNAFGHIETGDLVRVEQQPVIRNGEVFEKGLVRKKRGD